MMLDIIPLWYVKNMGNNWYNINQNTARGLVLIILRSSKLIKITVGKLFQLSIATLGDVNDINVYKKERERTRYIL